MVATLHMKSKGRKMLKSIAIDLCSAAAHDHLSPCIPRYAPSIEYNAKLTKR
jgi:hypothetical protein